MGILRPIYLLVLLVWVDSNRRFFDGSHHFEELIEYAYKNAPNTTKLQTAAIVNVNLFRSRNTSYKKPLLCAVFMGTTKTSLDILENNMKYLGVQCDWAAIAYAGDLARLERLRKRATSFDAKLVHISVESESENEKNLMPNYTFTVNSTSIDSAQSYEVKNVTFKHIPKPLLYYRLLPLLPTYQRLFLLDEDMSFQDFNLTRFLNIIDCSDHPRPSPYLVAQALVAENTQWFKYFNARSWEKIPVIATAVGYIEQQAPLMDSGFFDWFIRYIVTPITPSIRILGSDWSFDDTWCRAAAFFARTAYHRTPPFIESCLLVIKGTPIHHLNSKKLHYLHLRRNEFGKVGNALRNITAAAFPMWYVPGHKAVDPLHPKNRNEARRSILNLHSDCQIF